MHRSGTSALAGVLGLLGASLPKNLMPSNSDNPKGFFEPDDIVAIHEEMLSAFGSSWVDFRRLDSSMFDSEAVAPFKTRLVAAMKNNYGDATKYVLKDPRICRLFPLWRSIFAFLGVETRVISVIRNPLEVARSLAQRDGLSHAYSSNLWLRHVLDSEFATRDSTRIFVRYADFMRDWMHVIDEIESEIGIELLDRTQEVQAAVEAFIDSNARHHAVDGKTLAFECRDQPLVLKTYHALEKLVGRSSNPRAMKILDDVRESFDEATRAFDIGFGADLISAQYNLYLARRRIAERTNEITDLKAQLLAMQNEQLLWLRNRLRGRK